MATADYNGVQKAAILLITLGPERSADIFKHLKEEEIEELTLEIANTRSVSPQVKEDILNEFYQVCLAQQYIAEGGIGYAKELLDKALGQEKAQEVISKLTASLSTDDCNDFIISDSIAGGDGFRSTSTGETGGCCKEDRNDGSYITGCDQRGGASVRKKTFFSGQPGLHDCRRCRCDREYLKYGRPFYREAYYGIS